MSIKSRDFSTAKVVLDIKDLTVTLPDVVVQRPVLNGISLSIRQGETVCLVGESGSGKSVTSLAVMGLLPRGVLEVTNGSIRLDGTELRSLSQAQMRNIRANKVAMIFQEPMTALNPVMRVGDQIAEVLNNHTSLSASERRLKVIDRKSVV